MPAHIIVSQRPKLFIDFFLFCRKHLLCILDKKLKKKIEKNEGAGPKWHLKYLTFFRKWFLAKMPNIYFGHNFTESCPILLKYFTSPRDGENKFFLINNYHKISLLLRVRK